MAQRQNVPFAEPRTDLPSKTNPYLGILLDCHSKNDIPLMFGRALAEHKGKWREYFADKHALPSESLVFEIGTHLGKSLCEYAQAEPTTAFIGCDITFKRVVTSAQRAADKNLANVLSTLFNARFIDELFAPEELDGIIIFFPDPWMKKRKQKHRLINLEFAQRAFRTVKPGGFLWFKTDQQSYFEQAICFFEEAGFRKGTNYSRFLEHTFVSTFERKFAEKKLPTYEMKFHKA